MYEVTPTSKATRTANPARPKTNPERALLSRKDFPLDPEAPAPVGEVEEEVVSVTVTGPFGPFVVNWGGDVGEDEGTVDSLSKF